MCNEDMALQIQQGNKELLPQLWDNLYKLIYKYANSFYINYYDRCSSVGILLDDLLQEGYFAMLSCIEAYKPESGYKLTAFLRFPLKNQFASIVGLRSKQKGNDALNKAVSLDTTIDDDGDISLGDTIEDTKAQDELNRIISDEYTKLLHDALEESMQDLTCIQKDFIKQLYYENLPLSQIAAQRKLKIHVAVSLKQSGLHSLRTGKGRRILKPYHDEILSNSAYKGTSLTAFRNTWSSSVERTVMKIL